MRDRAKTFLLVLRTALQADPWRTIGAVVLEGTGQVWAVLVGVWLRAITDGVLTHNLRSVVIGAVGMVGVPAVLLLSQGVGIRMRLTLIERAGFAFERKYAETSARLRTLTHLEHPEFRDKLELLQQNTRLLANSANGVVYMLIFLIRAAVTLLVVASVDPLLMLLPLFGIPYALAAKTMQNRFKKDEEITAPVLRRARHLYVLGVEPGPAKELRVFRLRDELKRRHEEAWMFVHKRMVYSQIRSAIEGSLGYLAFTVGFVGAIVLVTLRAVNGQATVGDVVLTITVASQVTNIVSNFMWQLSWFMESLRNADRFRWLLEHADEEAARDTTGPAPDRLHQGITFRDMTFRYPGTDIDVLKDVNVTIPAGSVVALVGENGAGKTTICKLLSRFYDPTSGAIGIDGIDLTSIDAESWRSKMAAGYQDFAKLEFLVQQSVGVGDLPQVDSEPAVVGALDRSGGSDVLATLTDGLGTQLGRTWAQGAELSGGQWQKLALGRALMRDRPLLTVFDEPTASLDAETEHLLFERYAEEARTRREDGAITILVSHRFSTVRTADLIVVVDKGGVVASGTHEELMARGGLYAELYTIQAKSYE